MILNTLESKTNLLDVNTRHVNSPQMSGVLGQINPEINARFIGGQCQKKAVCIKLLIFLNSYECKINIKNFDMEVSARNSNKKTGYF